MIVDCGGRPPLFFKSTYGCLSAKAVTANSHIVQYTVMMKAGNVVHRMPCDQMALSNIRQNKRYLKLFSLVEKLRIDC